MKRLVFSPSLLCFIFIFFIFKNNQTIIKCANENSTISLKGINAQLTLNTALDFSGTLVLRDNTSSTISGNNINFTDGILKTGNLTTNITGVYDADGVESLLLNGGKLLNVQAGQINLPIFVSGINNYISGRMFLSEEITIQDSSSSLNISIQTNLSKNINLTSGSLNLDADLKLADNVNIVGPGTINFDGNQLAFGVAALNCTTDLNFSNNVNINLSSNITLDNCSWIFPDTTGESIINGNGNTIFLGQNGKIQVGQGHTLFLNNVVVKGLSDSLGSGKFIFFDDSSILKMRQVTLDIIEDFTLSVGQIYLQDTSCVLISKSFLFYITNNAVLTVDGVALIWDKLNLNNDNDPIVPSSTNNLNLINGGFIRNINTTLQPTFIYETSFSASSNIELTNASVLVFSNDTPLISKPVFINGNGHSIYFSRDDTFKNFVLEDNVQLTMVNFVLKDFNPEIIQLGANSTITFGDDITFELGKDITISRSFSFKGNIIINGRGLTLTLDHDDSIVLNSSNKSLVLKNLILKGIGGSVGRLRMNYATDSITFSNVDIYLEDDYSMNLGAFNFEGNVKFVGKDHSIVYTSAQQSTIFEQSSLIFDRGVTFSYAANVGVLSQNGTASSYLNSRNRLRMVDPTSIIVLDGATMHFTHTGLVLNNGTMIIKDHSVLKSVAAIDEGTYGHGVPAVGEEPVLGTNFYVNILSSAIFDVQGRVIYS